jgi:hypothetical protein
MRESEVLGGAITGYKLHDIAWLRIPFAIDFMDREEILIYR